MCLNVEKLDYSWLNLKMIKVWNVIEEDTKMALNSVNESRKTELDFTLLSILPRLLRYTFPGPAEGVTVY